jgi:RNA recognition motif-containing protein
MSASSIVHRSRGKNYDHPPSRGTESNIQHEPTRTLFVENLERDIRKSKLEELFRRYGTIEESKKI